MDWLGFATDFDGTLATDGVVDRPAREALQRLRSAGVKVILVTGRELTDFANLEPILELFDSVVAENGAVLFEPKSRNLRPLGVAPPSVFVDELARLGVTPISVGTSILATREPHESTVLRLIKEMGLELQIIFNKGAVMVLPSGINKASGLRAALGLLNIPPACTVGVGDAENDHAFLDVCGLAVAVANALPALKQKAQHVTLQCVGAGVTELIDGLMRGDFLKPPVAVVRPAKTASV